MRRWDLSIALDPSRDQPLFLQLANAIAEDIGRGRLKPGEPLPGSRELASSLGVNRNTVVAGYEELVAEGMARTRVGGGTFVAASMPARLKSVPPASEGPTYALAAPTTSRPAATLANAPGELMLVGLPDVRLLPARPLARAFGRVVGRRGRSVLTYADPCGHPRLRAQLAAMLSRTRGLLATPGNVMVTRGIEQGIDLVARSLITPGDVVAVEAFGYPPAWSMLRMAGARLAPLPLDEEGLELEALERLLQRERVRAVFLTPHHQFPTASVMSARRRAQLAELALRHRFAIIEDDYDHEFHYDGKPVLPIAAGAGRANVIYLGSLSNLLAPGVSTGFAFAPPPVLERMIAMRAQSDAKGDAAVECAIAELFEDGEFLRHVRRMRRTYAARRDALAIALAQHLGSALSFQLPAGGMAIWARVDASIDTAAWIDAAAREGVRLFGASRYDFLQREQPYLRLGFTYHDVAELEEAVRRMAKALAATRQLQRSRERAA